jgi:predicted DNA-binding transcriptional regulator AlpA
MHKDAQLQRTPDSRRQDRAVALTPDTEVEQLRNEHFVAGVYGVSVSTIRRWRLLGKGPRFLKIGGSSVRYALADITEWMQRQPDGGDRGWAR